MVPGLSAGSGSSPWWERHWFLALVVLATTVPLLYPQIPPLVDLPGHIGRYRVELDLAHSPSLQRFYDYHWAPLGTLGVDVLVMFFAPLIGLEPAVKLIVLAIPPLTAAGFFWVAREVHGRVPPTAMFALPFIYGFPFLFGFVNFTLSVALAFLAFGLWLRLGRLERIRLRAWLFAPISLVLFFCHTYGWGLLGLMCFSANAVRLRDLGATWARAAFQAALHVGPMALPLAVMLMTPAPADGAFAGGWFDWDAKWVAIMGVLRDRWGPLDVTSLEVAGLVFLFALASPKLRLARRLAGPALLLVAAFVLLPRFIMDSAYADERLVPYLAALALLAIRRPADPRLGKTWQSSPSSSSSCGLAGRRQASRWPPISSRRSSGRSIMSRKARGSRPSTACHMPSPGRCSATATSAGWSLRAGRDSPTTNGSPPVTIC